MRNKKLITLVVLGVVAIFSLFYGAVTSSKVRRPSQVREPGREPERKASLIEKPILAQRAAKRTNYTSWSRNPFVLQKTSSKSFKGLTLDGIMWDKGKSMAIINGEIVRIGDNVNENLVVDIKQDRVILNDGIKEFELKLN